MIDSTSSIGGTMLSSTEMGAVGMHGPLPTDSYSWSDVPMVFLDDITTICNRNFSDYSLFSSSPSPFREFPSSSQTSRKFQKPTATGGNNSKKNVRFAPLPEIRIYSLVLGDHPLCNDGLAIELGWDYYEHDSQEIVTNNNKPTTRYRKHTGKTTRMGCQKRPYLTRKQLLLDVAGCTYEELDQRSRDMEARNSLNTLSRRSQDYDQSTFERRRE